MYYVNQQTKGGTMNDTAKKARAAYQRERRARMTPEEREKEREYMAQWRKDNPEKVAAAQERFYLKKARELNAE